MRPETAVLLMAYGTPRTRDQIEPYYTDIRRGRPPTPEQLADLTARYDALGGTSPLAARTDAQRDALQAALDSISPGSYRVVLGLKHADPKVEAAVDALAADGQAGVKRMLEIMQADILRTLTLIGVPRYADVDRSAIRRGDARGRVDR